MSTEEWPGSWSDEDLQRLIREQQALAAQLPDILAGLPEEIRQAFEEALEPRGTRKQRSEENRRRWWEESEARVAALREAAAERRAGARPDRDTRAGG